MSTIITPQGTNSNLRASLVKLRDAAKSERDRKARERDWDRSERAYKGRIFSDVDRADWRSFTQSPKLWEVIARYLPIVTDQRPKFTLESTAPESILLEKQLCTGADWAWDHLSLERKTALWAKRAMKTGTSFLHTGMMDTPRGYRPYVNLLDHRNVFPDPGATDDEDWQSCWVHVRLTLEQIQDLYGDAGLRLIFDKKLKPTEGPRDTTGAALPEQVLGGAVYAQAGSAATIAGGAPYNEQLIVSPLHGQADDTRYDVWEFYFYDRSTVDVEDELDDGEPVTVRLQRFDNPRWITLINDNYSPDLDREYDCAHGEIPVIRLACDDDDSEFWAGGLIAPLVDSVELISNLQNSIMNAARLCGSPWWKVSSDSGVKVDTLYGEAGQVVVFNPGSTVEMVAPPPLPQYIFELWNRLTKQVDDASGITDISRGQINMDEGISGKAIQLGQEPTYTRMRLFLRNLEGSLSKLGHQVVSNMVQYWTPEQWAKILSTEDQAQGLAWTGWSPEDIREMAKIRMTTGSTLPPNKDQRLNTAVTLANAGAFNPATNPVQREEMLKAADWPDYTHVVDEVTQAAASAPQPTEQGPTATDRANALASLLSAIGNYSKMGLPLPIMDLDSALNALGFPPWDAAQTAAKATTPGPAPQPPGPNKALGQGPSPESQVAVAANPNGQEVPSGTNGR